MSNQGRSLDDLPLAAYSTGMVDEEPAEDAEPESAHTPMDARAAALSLVDPASVEPPSGAAPEPADRHVVVAVDGSTRPATSEVPRPARQRVLTLPGGTRVALRDPRLLAGGGVVVGLLLLAAALSGGLTSGAATPAATASPAPTVVPRPPGAATLSLSGGVTGEYALTGSTGFGRPAGDRLASTWTDALGTSLTLTGQATSGTRPTGPDLVLTWTVVVDGTAVMFTSDAGECVVGMAVKPGTVSGSLTCEKLKSDDGTVVVNVSGSYRT